MPAGKSPARTTMTLSSLLLLTASHSGAATCAPPKLGTAVPEFSISLRSMHQDRKGHYWFGSSDEGVSRYDGKTIVRFTTQDGLAGDLVFSIYEDKKGDLLFATSGGVSLYDGKSFRTLKPIVMNAPDKGWRLHPDDVWLAWGTNEGGPSRYDGKNLYALKFPKHHLEAEKLARKPVSSMYAIYTIYKDKRGHIWFGTADAGLCRYDGKSINWLYEDHLTNAPNGGSFGIRSIIEDRDGKFWVCNTKSRFAVSETNRASHGMIGYQAETGTGDLTDMIQMDRLYFQSVVMGKEGDLWMMPWGGGIFRYDGQKLTHYPVKDDEVDAYMSQIYRDRDGTLWICTQTNGPYRFDGKAFVKFEPAM